MSSGSLGNILIVDDEKGMCHILKRLLSDKGYHVDTALSGEEALKCLAKEMYDAAMLDIRMPGMDGLELLGIIRRDSPDTSVVMMTAYGTVETAVTAMKQGAYEYITKPFNNDEVVHIIGNAVERKRLLDRNRYLTRALEERDRLEDMVGKSEPMQELFTMIEKVAPTDSTVLILGESGSGKELVARAIHKQSNRKKANFLAINCAALPKELIESELFGHEKGAFSGAHKQKIGVFEAADGGTLFLDEIGDLPLELQVKLLRVLEQKEIRRVGSVQAKAIDARVIAATNQHLKEKVEEGLFREDLFYRLSIMDLHLPPLRERRDDIPLLTEHFISLLNKKMNRSIEGVDPEAMRVMIEYNWRGNVRELENVIQRCMVLRENGIIQVDDLPSTLSSTSGGETGTVFDPVRLTFHEARELFEQTYLKELLAANEENVTQSAQMAGISRRHLQELMKKYGLRPAG